MNMPLFETALRQNQKKIIVERKKTFTLFMNMPLFETALRLGVTHKFTIQKNVFNKTKIHIS